MADQKQTATHWRTVHKRMNENLLFAEDLGGLGGKVDVEIVDSGVAMVKGSDDSKNMPWIAFRGVDGKPKQKRLALNVTNSKTMQSIAATGVIEQWRGWITLVVVITTYFDQKTKQMEKTEAIRIAPKRPSRETSKPTEPAQKSEPAPDEKARPTDDEMREIAMKDREEAARG